MLVREHAKVIWSDLKSVLQDFSEDLWADGTDLKSSLLRYYRESPWLQGCLQGLGLLIAVGVLDSVLGRPTAMKMAYVAPIVLATRRGGGFSGALLILASLGAVADSYLTDGHPHVRIDFELMLTSVVFVTAAVIVSKQEKRFKLVHHSANHDSLTGALNRMGFTLEADQKLDAAKTSLECVSLAVIDCNKFKQLNDTHGHAAGDAVLQSLVRAIRSSAGEDCLIGRQGGDEFVVLAPGRRGYILSRWLMSAQEKFGRSTHQMGFQAGFAFGVVETVDGSEDLQSLLDMADAEMYRVKSVRSA